MYFLYGLFNLWSFTWIELHVIELLFFEIAWEALFYLENLGMFHVLK